MGRLSRKKRQLARKHRKSRVEQGKYKGLSLYEIQGKVYEFVEREFAILSLRYNFKEKCQHFTLLKHLCDIYTKIYHHLFIVLSSYRLENMIWRCIFDTLKHEYGFRKEYIKRLRLELVRTHRREVQKSMKLR